MSFIMLKIQYVETAIGQKIFLSPILGLLLLSFMKFYSSYLLIFLKVNTEFCHHKLSLTESCSDTGLGDTD